MRLSAVAIALSVAFANIGCGEPGSAAGPSPLRPDSASGPAGTAGTPDGTASASAPATVAIKGRLQGDADPPVFEPPPSPYFTAHLSHPRRGVASGSIHDGLLPPVSTWTRARASGTLSSDSQMATR